MSLAALLFSAAAFVFSLEMWHRKHPPASLESQAADTAQWIDRFAIPDSGAALPAVGAYLDFVAESGSRGGLIHNYVNHGMRQLTRALLSVSGLNLRVGTVERMHIALGRYVDSLQAHPRWALDPGRVRPAMLMAVEIMRSLGVPQDELLSERIGLAEKSALSLEADKSTLWQRSKIQDFFIHSGQALVLVKVKALAGTGGPAKAAP